MPTILRVSQFRFFFYSSDREEAIHVHVEHEDKIAKFWIDPIRLQESGGFNRSELITIQKIIEQNSARIVEKWNEYFNG